MTFIQQVLELKNNRKNDSYSTSAWPTETKSAWAAEEPIAPEPVADEPAPAGYQRYRAIYEFAARNNDEITFQPGDIVMVSNKHEIQLLHFIHPNISIFRFHLNKTVKLDG